MTDTTQHRERSSADGAPDRRHWLLALGLVAGASLAVLLWHELFWGQAQSFDTMLYARSLWGVAHGEPVNSVLEAHAFALHGHFLMVVLAPLCRVMPAALALVVGQGLAFGLSVWLVGRACYEAAAARGAAVALWVGLAGAVLLLAGTPHALNPFFFDARPDLLGVPFLVAGLLRAVRLGGFDWRAILLMLPAALAREELALTVASALILAPDGPVARRQRFLVAAAATCYFVAYYAGLRPLLGGSDASAILHLGGSREITPSSWTTVLLAKGELLAVLATSGGGLIWLGRRWLGSIVPGVVILGLSRWLPEGQIGFHYGMLVAPGLLAAGVAGLRQLLSRDGPWVRAALAGVVAVAGASYLLEGAGPGGRRFAATSFDVPGLVAKLRGGRSPAGSGRWWEEAQRRLRHIPSQDGVAVPWALGAPLADRSLVLPTETLRLRLQADTAATLPPELTTVALYPSDVPATGRLLVTLRGYRLAGFAGPRVTLLTTDHRRWRTPWERLGSVPPARCRAPVARWPGLGLDLCALEVPADRPAAAWLTRRHVSREEESVVTPVVWPEPPAQGRPMPLWLAGGLVSVAELPVGMAAQVMSDQPWHGGPSRLVMVTSRGEVVPPSASVAASAPVGVSPASATAPAVAPGGSE